MPNAASVIEDIRQEALSSLWEATATWDEAGGRAWSSYAHLCVRGAVHKAAWAVQFWGLNGNRAAYQKGWRLLSRVDEVPQPWELPPDPLAAKELADRLLIAARPGTEREAVRRHYLNDESRVELAESLGLSRERIEQAIRDGVRRMKGAAATMGLFDEWV